MTSCRKQFVGWKYWWIAVKTARRNSPPKFPAIPYILIYTITMALQSLNHIIINTVHSVKSLANLSGCRSTSDQDSRQCTVHRCHAARNGGTFSA